MNRSDFQKDLLEDYFWYIGYENKNYIDMNNTKINYVHVDRDGFAEPTISCIMARQKEPTPSYSEINEELYVRLLENRLKLTQSGIMTKRR